MVLRVLLDRDGIGGTHRVPGEGLLSFTCALALRGDVALAFSLGDGISSLANLASWWKTDVDPIAIVIQVPFVPPLPVSSTLNQASTPHLLFSLRDAIPRGPWVIV